MSLSGPRLLFLCSCCITNWISFHINCSDFLFFPGSLLEGCMFLGIYALILDCPVYWHIIFHIFLKNPLYFCGVGCYLSSLISDFVWDVSLFFFLWWAYQFCLLCWSFQRTSSWFHCIVFFFILFHLFMLQFLFFPSSC